MWRRSWIIAVLLVFAGGALYFTPYASASNVNDNAPAIAATGGNGLRVLRYDTTGARLLTQDFVRGAWTPPAIVATPPGARQLTGAGIAADPRTGTTVSAVIADGVVWARLGSKSWSRIATGSQGAPAVAGFGHGAFAVVARFGAAARVR